MKLKAIRLLLLSTAAVLLVACGVVGSQSVATPTPKDTQVPPIATPTPVVKAAPIATPAPKVTATPTQVPPTTATPAPTPTATPLVGLYSDRMGFTPIPVITPNPTPTAGEPIPLLEAFEATATIVFQEGGTVRDLEWSLINNSQQKVDVLGGKIHRANETVMFSVHPFGTSLGPNDELGPGGTSFPKSRTIPVLQEEIMASYWVWTIRTQTGKTIVCTFTKANPKSCVYTSKPTPAPTDN